MEEMAGTNIVLAPAKCVKHQYLFTAVGSQRPEWLID